MLQESVGIADIKYASTFPNSGQRDVKVEIPATDLTFLCENVDVSTLITMVFYPALSWHAPESERSGVHGLCTIA